MKQKYKSTHGLVILIVVALLSGCFGGGSGTPKTYKLTVIVLDDTAGTPFEGARVEVVGKGLDAKETNAAGQVSFLGLSGTVEVLVQLAGYITTSQSVVMNKEQSVTIRLAVDEETTVVDDEEGLIDAVNDPEAVKLSLAADVIL